MVLRFWLLIVASIMPLLSAFLFRVPRVALDNFTDAVFYLSYSRQFGELVLRYGFPYYATRFGGILPDALSGHLFGEINGIWMLRWLLSAAVSLTLFFFFRKRYGVLAGLTVSLLWSLNPAALRLLCTTYVDSTAVPFLILGCCLFASGYGRNLGSMLAGVLLALAASAHLYAAFALILLIPWLVASRWENRPQLLKSMIWMGAGFFATFAAGWLWYVTVWQMPALFSPTIEVMKNLGGGQTALWKKPLSVALHETPAWFAPLILLIPVVIVAIRGNPMMRGAALSLFGSCLFFWGGDLFGSAYVLSMPFYFSFLLPVTVLASATLCGELIESQRCAIGGYLLVVASVLCLGAASVLVYCTGIFAQFLGHYPRNDMPVLELAFALRRELPKASKDGAVVRFWYDDDLANSGGSDRRMIESFWLHTFGKLEGASNVAIPFASITSQDAEVLRASGPNRIVLMDQDKQKITQALQWITQASLPYRVAVQKSLNSPSDPNRKLEITILERKQSQQQSAYRRLDNREIQSLNRGHLMLDGESTKLYSGMVKGWECAKIPLGDLKKGEGIRLRFRIEQGRIRFTLHGENDADHYSVEKWMLPGDQEIVITVTHDLNSASLSLDSQYPSGSESRIVIEDIEQISHD